MGFSVDRLQLNVQGEHMRDNVVCIVCSKCNILVNGTITKQVNAFMYAGSLITIYARCIRNSNVKLPKQKHYSTN